MDEIEIANRVLEARRGETPLAKWEQGCRAAPSPGSFKVPGPGSWYETWDGELEWREGAKPFDAARTGAAA